MEVLVADFAGQMSHSSLLIDLGGNGVLMVTEEAWERGGEWLGLIDTLEMALKRRTEWLHTFFLVGAFAAFLRFPLGRSASYRCEGYTNIPLSLWNEFRWMWMRVQDVNPDDQLCRGVCL